MPRANRREICNPDQIQVFHLVNRCVRRTFLFGTDEKSGKDFSHRKAWIRQRLEELAGIFAVEILGFAVQSNHLHVVVRTRPDVQKGWNDTEIAQRWLRLFPQRRNEDKSSCEPNDAELSIILSSASTLLKLRNRLISISWFMRCVAEPIARRGNLEDDVTGRFWEGRFRAQSLLDESAIAACMAYVDLNPIRSGQALTPETSEFTSVRERILDRHDAVNQPTRDDVTDGIEHGPRAGWLSPISLEASSEPSRNKITHRRASNKGCLPMTLDQYLELLDWTGRQLKQNSGSIPQEFPSILERLDYKPAQWLLYVRQFRKVFRSDAGTPANRTIFRQQRRSRRAMLAGT